ncbi:NmrA family NAD(P)-binding protein [Streptomyces avicenniae]|uniref:NmrA family NAD(P)-binding protein n=1 Tax=Streptomyces avicenniae TaxID=500153 RepID=UPI00069C0695|nr:NmrA family NAD(P)-binding protein [Streptomyces avicenniae]
MPETAPHDGPVLVTGATGRQGGATAAHLLRGGRPVRALVRDQAAPAARALAAAGAELRTGDLDDAASLAAAAEGAGGVFAVTPDDPDPEREAARGVRLVDAAAEAGVGHVVFTSVGGADRDSGFPYWAAKWRVERHLAASGLRATVLRPVRFMENHTIPGLPIGGITGDALVHFFHPQAPVQLIAADDIGAFAALAFADPERYAGLALELAGDEMTSPQAAALIGRALGRDLTYRQVTPDGTTPGAAGAADAIAAVSRRTTGIWRADIPALRALHPGLMDLPTWLERGGAARVAALFTD